MDSVPHNFIERTILLASPPERLKSSPFCSLSGHWGRFASRLKEDTILFRLLFNVNFFPFLYSCQLDNYPQFGTVLLEDLLEKEHVCLTSLRIYSSPNIHPGYKKMAGQRREMLQRVISRSNGFTALILKAWPKEAALLATLLEAIPRVRPFHLNRLRHKSKEQFCRSLRGEAGAHSVQKALRCRERRRRQEGAPRDDQARCWWLSDEEDVQEIVPCPSGPVKGASKLALLGDRFRRSFLRKEADTHSVHKEEVHIVSSGNVPSPPGRLQQGVSAKTASLKSGKQARAKARSAKYATLLEAIPRPFNLKGLCRKSEKRFRRSLQKQADAHSVQKAVRGRRGRKPPQGNARRDNQIKCQRNVPSSSGPIKGASAKKASRKERKQERAKARSAKNEPKYAPSPSGPVKGASKPALLGHRLRRSGEADTHSVLKAEGDRPQQKQKRGRRRRQEGVPRDDQTRCKEEVKIVSPGDVPSPSGQVQQGAGAKKASRKDRKQARAKTRSATYAQITAINSNKQFPRP